jgi:5-oxopent-3-ene-1,2,5-tricarboxylate decarboxylase/2-hydroxyhepta-2,4-diene-1,7-dioate isomerase
MTMQSIDIPRPSHAILSQLKQLSSATIWGVLSKMGIPSVVIRGIKPLNPGITMVGPVQTLYYLPLREDKRYTPEWYRTSPPFQLANSVKEGDVIIVDAGGAYGYGGMGDVIITAYAVKSVGGMVYDGAIRDGPYAKNLHIPIFCRGTQPSVTPRLLPIAANVRIQCGGVLVEPGDVVFGDDDGVVVIPGNLVETVAQKGIAQEQIEVYSRKLLAAGRPLSDAYPPRDEWLTKPPI